MHQVLRLDRVCFDRLKGMHPVPPTAHLLLKIGEKGAFRGLGEMRQQGRQARGRIGDHGHLGGDAIAGTDGVGLDLHHLALPWLRQVLGVREVRPHHEQGVAALHGVDGRRGPEESDAADAEGVVIGDDGLPGQRLDDRAAQTFGRLQYLFSRPECSGSRRA